MLLDQIQKPNDIEGIPIDQLPQLAAEIREFLISHISKTGGHLASNLGVVELTMALHFSFHLPEDKIIWDVGHQSYTHKLLTGRREEFEHLRQLGGMSGFPKRSESACDVFDTGHSTTSISAGLGIAKAMELSEDPHYVIAVIGDGSLSGGMAYEAMNNACQLKRNFIIILNDNNMSIAPSVGGISQYLSGIRTLKGYNNLKEEVTTTLNRVPGIGEDLVRGIKHTKSILKQIVIPGMLFEQMGITYLGPVDGHDISAMLRVFGEAKKLDRAVLIHVRTQKGRGYEPAEKNPERYHGIDPFVPETGELITPKTEATYTDIFNRMLVKLADSHPSLCAITAAMPDGTGTKRFSRLYPERFFDVGIAEEHAVTYAAGLALEGYHPFFAVYSSFLQRGFDQILQDVCMQKLSVVFCIDRAGIVGEDGETHHGIFDFSYLRMIPNLTIMAPKNKYEFMDMLDFAADFEGPLAIRYPRGRVYKGLRSYRKPIGYGKAELLRQGQGVAILAIGTMVSQAMKAAALLKQDGIEATVVNLRFAKPLDTELLQELSESHFLYVTVEENVIHGGVGEGIAAFCARYAPRVRVCSIGIDDCFVPHGTVFELWQRLGLDAEGLAGRIRLELSEQASK